MLHVLDGDRPDRILVVGCEPASTDYGMTLSEPVAAAVEEAVKLVLALVGAGDGAVMNEPAGSARPGQATEG
jgi:hydrogenase maturation protease